MESSANESCINKIDSTDNDGQINSVIFGNVDKSKLNSFRVISSGNINEMTKQPDNSILKIKMNPNINEDFIVINSNFSIDYFSLNTQNAQLACKGIFNEHKSRINDATFLRGNNSPFNEAFITGDDGGNILIWDCRVKSSSLSLKTEDNSPVYSLDATPDFFCCGYGNEICMYDLKTMRIVGKSSFAHSEPITSVKFYDNYLISSGEDNIISIFNLSECMADMKQNKNIIDQERVELIMNTGQSIDKVNEVKPNVLGAITSVNTFQLLDLNTCSSFYEFEAKNEATNYVLDSFYDKKYDEISLLCGNFNGCLFDVRLSLGNTEKIKPVLFSCFESNLEQTFNTMGRYVCERDAYLFCSDVGMIYLMEESKK